jgi:thiamine biosynthesis lipoprotein
MKNYQLFIVCFLYSVLFTLALSGCTKQDRIYRESRMLMDTICTISVTDSSERKARKAVEAGFNEIQRLEQLLNYFSPESEISAINMAAGMNPVKVSRETLDVITEAVKIADYTGGAFDPTIGPLMKLWGFYGQSGEFTVPSGLKIKNAIRLVDYREVKINTSESEVFLGKKGMEIDLGGIAKGYAADRAIEVIRQRGIKAALVAIAGDIKGFGLKPDRLPWRIGIKNPRAGDNNADNFPSKRGADGDLKRETGGLSGEDVFATLYLKDMAVSTSGDYQRFFVKGEKRYHHILNPKTGFPSMEIISATVLSPDGFMADGLSTGIFILGRERGMKLLGSLGYSGVVVDRNREVFITDNLKGKITIEKDI